MKLKDIIFVVILNIIWGWNFIAVKYAVADFTPFLSNMLRFFIALIFFIPFLRIPSKETRFKLMRIAFLLGIMHFGLLYIGMSMAGGVSAIAIASQLNIPFATLCAVFLLGEKVGLPRITAIAISFLGVIIMGFDPTVFNYIDALGVISVSAFSFALGSVFMRELRSIPVMTIQAWVAVAAGFGSMILSLVFESGQITQITSAGSAAWGGILFSAICATLIGHGGMNYLLQKYEVNVVMPYLLLMPFFSLSASVLWLGEVLSPRMIVGAALTILGVIVITLRNRKKMQVSSLVEKEA